MWKKWHRSDTFVLKTQIRMYDINKRQHLNDQHTKERMLKGRNLGQRGNKVKMLKGGERRKHNKFKLEIEIWGTRTRNSY